MQKWYEDEYVLCPFYVKEKGPVLQCESPVGYPRIDTTLLVRPENKRVHILIYCRKNYKECPIYKDVMKKYEE